MAHGSASPHSEATRRAHPTPPAPAEDEPVGGRRSRGPASGDGVQDRRRQPRYRDPLDLRSSRGARPRAESGAAQPGIGAGHRAGVLMARRKTHAPLLTFLNDRLVGRLSKQPSGAIDFAYDPEWLAWEHTLPVSLSLPLREARYVGEPVAAVFENLLPDSTPVRKRVAERVGAAGTDAYSLLSAIGRDCVGALHFVPEDDHHDDDHPARISGDVL